MKKIIVLLLFSIPININAIDTSATSSILMDIDSNRILYEENIHNVRSVASISKIMTAVIAIESNKLDDKVLIGDEINSAYGSGIYIKKGEVLTLRDLLYGLMLRSGNDASVALANFCAGSVEEFCKLMNQMAKKVGANDTNFSNPHGLDNENHYTTARDLAKITVYALENPDFAQIVSTKNIKIPSKEESYRFLSNKNRLLNSLEGCIGVKTGFTSKAGRCLVSAVEREGMRVVCVVLNCGPMFEESAELINSVFNKYKGYSILEPYQFIADIPLGNGESNFVQVYSKNGLFLSLTEEEFANINIIYDLPKVLSAPIKSNEVVGKIEVYYGKHLIFSEKIYTIDDVDSKLLKDKVKDILDHWKVLG